MNLTDEEKDRAWEELVASTRPKRRAGLPEPNITVGELAEHEGIGRGAAYKRLERRVANGEFDVAKDIYIGGELVNVYWKLDRPLGD